MTDNSIVTNNMGITFHLVKLNDTINPNNNINNNEEKVTIYPSPNKIVQCNINILLSPRCFKLWNKYKHVFQTIFGNNTIDNT